MHLLRETDPDTAPDPEHRAPASAAAPPGRAPLRAWTPAAPERPAAPARGAAARREIGLGGAAAAFALLGIALLGAEPGRTWAVGLLAGAGALSILAWRRLPFAPAFAGAAGPPAAGTPRRRAGTLAGIALAGGLAGLADAQFLAQPGETFGLAGALWLLSMAGLILAAGAWPRAPRAGAARRAPWTRGEILVFAGLVVLACGLRVWALADFPANIYPDEIMTGSVASGAYLAGPPPPVFSTLWSGIDLPALWFLLVAWALKLGGSTLAMLRLPAALFGAATVIPFYALVRGVWGRAAASAGTAVLAFSASNLNYSRVALNNIVPQFFWAACFFFLLRGLQSRRPLDWVLAGIAAGLSEYGYYGTHLLPFILLAFAGYLLLVHWRQARALLGQMALLALSYGVAFGPLLAYYTSHPALYFGRATGLLTWNHIPTSWDDFQLMISTLWPLLAGTLLGISTLPSQDLVYFAPLLLAGEAAALVLGTALLVWHWRHPAAFLLLLTGSSVLVVGGVLVLYSAPPFLAHWTPAFPVFYAALALPFAAGLRTLHSARRIPQPTRGALRASAIVLGLLLAVLGWLNVDYYFGHYYADPRVLAEKLQTPQRYYEVQAAQSHWQAALGPQYRVYLVGPTGQPYDGPTTGYLVAGQAVGFLRNPARDLPVPAIPGTGLAFLFYPDTAQYRDRVTALYPGGRAGAVSSPYGRLLFYTYVLAPGGAGGG